MDISVILTYRCNSHCSMCNIWKYPSLPQEEISLETLSKIPSGLGYLNLTGGEPTLRSDLLDIVDLLYPKAMQLEISSNGLQPEKIEPVIKKYPNVKIRFSLEGPEDINNKIRGELNGFQTKINGLLKLKELGGTDLGLATVIQDENSTHIVDLYQLCKTHCFELSASTLHNGFQFHKNDNVPYNRQKVAKDIQELVLAYLKSDKIKDWFRAYMSLGLISKTLGHNRILKCRAATNFFFIDPWSDVFACNVRPDLKFGNLTQQSWNDLTTGQNSFQIRGKVNQCLDNCWMVGSAKTAMRNPKFLKIPRIGPLLWVLENKMRVTLGGKMRINGIIDFTEIYNDSLVPERNSYFDRKFTRRVQTMDEVHYNQFGEFKNK